jgi:DNA-binding MarR family transcriptional regulator
MEDALSSDLGFRLSRLARRLRTEWGERLLALDLNQPQAAILRALKGRGGLGLRELSRLIGTDPSNLRREIERLTKRELLMVVPAERSGLKATLVLTELGEQQTLEVLRLRDDMLAQTFDRLSSSDREAFTTLITTLETIVGIPGEA